LLLIHSCNVSGIGSVQEILDLIEKHGEEFVQSLLRFKIIAQETNG